jgi:hypothetical protein
VPNSRRIAELVHLESQATGADHKAWRICFEWREGAAWNVEIVDHHKG